MKQEQEQEQEQKLKPCHIVGFNGSLRSAEYYFQNECLVVHSSHHDHIIELESISGMNYRFRPDRNESQVIIETVEKLDQYWSPHYLILQVPTLNLVSDFSSCNEELRPLKHLMYDESIPRWSTYLPNSTPKVRRGIQMVVLTAEVIIFFWTLYLIMYQTPGFWRLLSHLLPDLSRFSFIFVPVAEILYLVKQWFLVLGQLIVLYTTPLTIFYRGVEPFINVLLIISQNLWRLVKVPFQLLWFFVKIGWSLIKLFFGKYVSFGSSGTGTPMTSGILYWIILLGHCLWETFLKPVKYLYILIRAPQTGELGRRINIINQDRPKSD